MLAQRHKYTTSFTLQALRKSLVWRITTLSRYMSSMKLPADLDVFRLLPPSCRDPLGRPIILFNLAAFFELASKSLDDTKDLILWLDDTMGQYLRKISEDSGQMAPVLQFVAIVNVQGVAVSSLVSTGQIFLVSGKLSRNRQRISWRGIIKTSNHTILG